MILNRTDNPLSRQERNKLNNNWDLIERGVSDADWKANNALDVANALIQNSFDEAALQTNIEEKLNALETEYSPQLTNLTTELNNVVNTTIFENEITVNNSEELISAINNGSYSKITLRNNVTYEINEPLTIDTFIEGKKTSVNVSTPFLTTGNTRLKDINFNGIDNSNDCIQLEGGSKIEDCSFYSFRTAIKQIGICVHGYIKNCTFAYNRNGVEFLCPDDTSLNNFVVDNNYFVKNGVNADDLTALGTEAETIGIGILLNGGCNHVVVRDNVFEYNTFCGVYATNTFTSKTNDSKILSNYFEGNKITAIMVDNIGLVETNQFEIASSFFSPRMTTNTDFLRTDVVIRGKAGYFNTIFGKNGEQILTGGNTNIIHDIPNNLWEIGQSDQYFSLVFDNSKPMTGSVKVLMRYDSNLNSLVTMKDGTDTSIDLFTFDPGVKSETVVIDIPSESVNKYTTRLLSQGEYIRIYEYRIL